MKITRSASAVTALAAALLLPSSVSAGGNADVRINQPGAGETLPVCNLQGDVGMARSGATVVATWFDAGRCEAKGRAPVPPLPDISFVGYAWSEDGGATWTDAGTIEPPAGTSAIGAPAIAAGPEGYFAVAFRAEIAGGSIIAVARSTDGGRSFAPAGRASGPADDDIFRYRQAITVSGSDLYVAWEEHVHARRSETSQLLLSRSTDGGATFRPPVAVAAPTAGSPSRPDLAVDPDDTLHVVWSQGGVVWTARSTDRASTFGPRSRVMDAPRTGHQAACLIGGWQQVLNGNIVASQAPSLAVDVGGSSDPDHPAFNPRRGTLYVAVAGAPRAGDEADILFTRSSDAGRTWSAPRLVNDDATATDQFHPQIEVGDSGRVGVTWYDRRRSTADEPNWQIDVYGAVSSDGGESFSPNARITDVAHEPGSLFPFLDGADVCAYVERNAMVPAGGGFLVAWSDNRSGTHEAPDLDVYADILGT